MKEENINELIKKVEELLDENHNLEICNMRLETERDEARQKERNNRHDAEKWFGGGFAASCIVGAICFFIGGFINGCSAGEDHYFYSSTYCSHSSSHSPMEVKSIKEYYTASDKLKFSQYELKDNIIVVDTVGKYNVGDIITVNKAVKK